MVALLHPPAPNRPRPRIEMLKVGQIAPDFSTVDQNGQPVSLSQLLSAGRLVLYFYPRDFTPVCTAQACTFRDAAVELSELKANVVGVSADPVESHQRFGKEHAVAFPLLADPERKIIKAYGATWPLIGNIRRVTYVIGTDRRILAAINHELSADKHLRDVRSALSAAG